MIRLLIVDDHDVVRMGLKQVFSGRVDMEVAGEARTGEEAIAQVRRLPTTSRWWTCPYRTCPAWMSSTAPRRSGPEMAVLIVSGYPEDQYAINLLKAGASGFVAKDAPSENLVSAVVAAAQGRRYVSPRIAGQARAGPRRPGGGPAFPYAVVGARVPDLLQGSPSGQSVSEIAKELFLSVKTVSTYRSRILEKMNFKSNADITYYAVKNQLIA
jgi:DNA-binding NarL/FixJ family response regulator